MKIKALIITSSLLLSSVASAAQNFCGVGEFNQKGAKTYGYTFKVCSKEMTSRFEQLVKQGMAANGKCDQEAKLVECDSDSDCVKKNPQFTQAVQIIFNEVPAYIPECI